MTDQPTTMPHAEPQKRTKEDELAEIQKQIEALIEKREKLKG